MARNRKRAKERRARRPQPVTARTREEAAATGAPNPLDHAAPDAEIAAAAEIPVEIRDGERYDEEPYEEEPFEEDDEEYETSAGGAAPPDEGDGDYEGEDAPLPEPAAARAAERRASSGNRLLTFLQGSWRELQRVQWPDRRQVMQATGVVIGFVIVAGVFLGVADWVAGKVVSFIVNGHF